jgi:large conductance mechanosensitive channel
MSVIREFKDFIMRGNVVDLAVGIIIGAAFTAIVNSMVDDLINPIISLATNGLDFSNMFLNLSNPLDNTYPTIEAAKAAGVATLNYGHFINAVIKFIIVGFSVFLLVKAAHRLIKKKQAGPAATPEDVLLLREIRDLLKK